MTVKVELIDWLCTCIVVVIRRSTFHGIDFEES